MVSNLTHADGDGRPYTGGMDDTREARETQTSPAPTRASVGEKCEVCGAEMFGLHCKLVCPNCGYRRDCSDP